jgi:hypothetical protein
MATLMGDFHSPEDRVAENFVTFWSVFQYARAVFWGKREISFISKPPKSSETPTKTAHL